MKFALVAVGFAFSLGALSLVGCAGADSSGDCQSPPAAAVYAFQMQTPVGCEVYDVPATMAFREGAIDASNVDTITDACTSHIWGQKQQLTLQWAPDWRSASGTFKPDASACSYPVSLEIK